VSVKEIENPNPEILCVDLCVDNFPKLAKICQNMPKHGK
jgi:hypothetical protein